MTDLEAALADPRLYPPKPGEKRDRINALRSKADRCTENSNELARRAQMLERQANQLEREIHNAS